MADKDKDDKKLIRPSAKYTMRLAVTGAFTKHIRKQGPRTS